MIPEAAVEAAAAEIERRMFGPVKLGALARAALEAAAPHMLAEAWDSAMQAADDDGYLYAHQTEAMQSLNPYRAATGRSVE